MTTPNCWSELSVGSCAAPACEGIESRGRLRVSNHYRGPEIVVARWTDPRTEFRRMAVAAGEGQVVLDIALAPAHVRLVSNRKVIFDGSMPSGMTYVCHPGDTLRAEYSGPADFLRLHVAGDLIEFQAPQSSLGASADASFAVALFRDALIDHLARALQAATAGASERYVESLTRAVIARAAQIRPKKARVSPLPQWRLARVVEYIEAHLSEAISLADLAAAAELSRAHFAVQFRLATGCRPHDFILMRRIEAAKRLLAQASGGLADVAQAVGFRTQAHFSNVFKRFVGDTPGGWRRLQLGYDFGPPGQHAASLLHWVSKPA